MVLKQTNKNKIMEVNGRSFVNLFLFPIDTSPEPGFMQETCGVVADLFRLACVSSFWTVYF